MVEERNIVILGASFSGLMASHYILQHVLPELKARQNAKYKVYLLNASPEFYFRIASPRVATSTKLMAAEKVFFDIRKGFKQYAESDFTFIVAPVTGVDTSARSVSYKRNDYLSEESLTYHALIVATGSRTFEPAFSQSSTKEATLNGIKALNKKIASAKDIVIVGGGPTGVETAGEIGELLNGKPGWFSTPRKANITLITASDQLLNPLRPALGKVAEDQLKKLGVDVRYKTRVANHTETSSGRTKVILANGETVEADAYINAHGVVPNTDFLPEALLTDRGYLNTNPKTSRVDDAGPRVYALGDVASYTRNIAVDLYDGFPVLITNLRRDLLSYDSSDPTRQPAGKDRLLKLNESEMMFVPVGSFGGVGAIFGYKMPSWVVWLLKSRDFFLSMGTKGLINGEKVKKPIPWTKEEAVY